MIDPEITKALRKALMQPNAISCVKELKGASLDEIAKAASEDFERNYERMRVRQWCSLKVTTPKKIASSSYNDARQTLGRYGLETPKFKEKA